MSETAQVFCCKMFPLYSVQNNSHQTRQTNKAVNSQDTLEHKFPTQQQTVTERLQTKPEHDTDIDEDDRRTRQSVDEKCVFIDPVLWLRRAEELCL